MREVRRKLKDQTEGRAVALAAEYHGAVVGYINVYPNSKWDAFAGRGYPDIMDFDMMEQIDALMDEEFEVWMKYHFSTCEREELQDYSNYLLHIARIV